MIIVHVFTLARNHCFKVTLVYGEKIILLLKKHQPLCEISQLKKSLYHVQVKLQSAATN